MTGLRLQPFPPPNLEDDDDDPFGEDFFFGVPSPPPVDAALVWRERERRSRTLRLLVMFLLMLMLLDGEEQQNRRRRTDGSSGGSRRGSGGSVAKKGGGAGGGRAKGSESLGRDVWTARRALDELIERATIGSERRSGIIASNGGRDVEGEVWDRVAAWDLERREKEEDRKEGIEGEGGARNDGGDPERWFDDDPQSDEEGGNEKVRHYPRNVTGFYRGEWKRIPYKPDGFMVDHRLVASSSREEGGRETAASGGESSGSSGSPSALRVVEPSAIVPAMALRLGERRERVGVYLLPAGLALDSTRPIDNVTLSLGRTEGGLIGVGPREGASSDLEDGSRSPPSLLPHTLYQSYEMTAASTPPPSLSLLKPRGRAALQLFLRPVPAMTELSLVEGFVKLYDGPSSSSGGFRSLARRDILLRVRGVMVHSIGRISLVSSAAPGRSALVWKRRSQRDDDDGGGGGTTGKDIKMAQRTEEDEEEEGEVSWREEDEEEEEVESRRRRRRRLEESVSDLLAANGSGGAASINAEATGRDDDDDGYDDLLARIRDDAVALLDDAEQKRSAGRFFGGSGGSIGEMRRKRASMIRSFDRVEGQLAKDGGPNGTGVASFLRRERQDDLDDPERTSLFGGWLRSSLRRHRRRLLEAMTPGAAAAAIKIERSSAAATDREATAPKSRRTTADADASDFAARGDAPDEKKRASPRRELDDDDDVSDVGVAPYAYVPDDDRRTIRRAIAASVDRRLPSREQALEDNTAGCEFELNFDVSTEEWTAKRWRESASRRAREVRELVRESLLRSTMEDDGDGGKEQRGAGPDDGDDGRTKADTKREAGTASRSPRRRYADNLSTTTNEASTTTPDDPVLNESLVMTLAGTIVSHDCRFASYVNVTARRTDWERITGKAANYSFVMMLACLVQIVVLLRQLLHTQSQSVAVRVSLLCVGWQTVLDAMVCAGHVMLCVFMQPLFTAFASVAFFKLLIFCVIEMKYMAIILQAREDAANGGAGARTTAEALRRRLALLHMKFYGALLTALATYWYAGERHRTAYALALYSFWVPQIVLNVVTEAKRPLHPYYVFWMSATRLVAPLYVLGVPDNFLREVNPDFPTDPRLCRLLLVWVIAQMALLIAQGRYGTRFMIPARFLPPKFDYGRPIPASMLPRPTIHASDDGPGGMATAVVRASDSGGNGADATIGVTRNRIRGNRSGTGSRDANSLGATMNGSGGGVSATLDCVICYNEIDVHDRREYMLAPCDHIFHRECLERWMDVKMECPICRKELPAL